ncbi:MAG: hypothetical protein ABIJ86_02050 [Spirochaetota bacterium]
MTIEILGLCDFAQDAYGKLTLVGAFDAITVHDFPAVHPFMCVAARIRFPIYELGEHTVRVEIIGPDGSFLVPPMDGKLAVNGIGGDSACANLTLNLMNLHLKDETSWRINLAIDGHEKAMIPLYIRKATH